MKDLASHIQYISCLENTKEDYMLYSHVFPCSADMPDSPCEEMSL